MYGHAVRRGLRAVVRRVQPRALILPGAAVVWLGARYSAATTGAASPVAVLAARPAGDAAGAAAISSASYPANDPLEDRWVVARVRLPAASAAAASRPEHGLFAPGLGGHHPAAAAAPRTLLLAAVMDGHGGWQASDFVQSRLADVVESELQHNSDNDSPEQLAAALSRAFERLDRDFIARVRPAFEVRRVRAARCVLRRRASPPSHSRDINACTGASHPSLPSLP